MRAVRGSTSVVGRIDGSTDVRRGGVLWCSSARHSAFREKSALGDGGATEGGDGGGGGGVSLLVRVCGLLIRIGGRHEPSSSN